MVASGKNTAANPLLLAALTYAKRGWQVFPCRPRDKQPVTRHGFKDATTDTATLVRAWAARPRANIGIATGAASGIVVLDVDPRNGGDASIAELERVQGPLPETVSVATGDRGRHLYFAAPEGARSSGDLADGVEVKADGRYVIAPPSVHPNGNEYRWVNEPGKTKLAPCPEWVRPGSSTKPAKSEQPIDAVPDAGATPLGRAFSAVGMLGRRLDAGKRSVACPGQDKHTTGKLQDSSTVIFPANVPDGLGGFHCSHAHCAARSVAEVLRELERRAAAGSAERAWMSELRMTPKGELKASFGNLVLILTHDPSYSGKLRLDEMRGAVLSAEAEMTDAEVSAIRVDIEKRHAIQPGDAETARAVQLVASKNAFHPVRDFLSQLKWDGVPRLDHVASKILRVRADSEEEGALAALLVRRWFIGLVHWETPRLCRGDSRRLTFPDV